MRKRILGFVFAAAVLAAMAVPLFGGGTALAVPAHVHNPNHCQNLANGQLNAGVHTAHIEADVVIPSLCGHP